MGLSKRTLTLLAVKDNGTSPIECQSSNRSHEHEGGKGRKRGMEAVATFVGLCSTRSEHVNGLKESPGARRMALTTTVHLIIHDGDYLKMS